MYRLPSPEYLALSYRVDLDLLVGRWMGQPTLTELQEGYNLLLNTAAPRRCLRWLIDSRRRDPTSQLGISWVVNSFYPQLASRLEGRVLIAFLLSPTHLSMLEKDASLTPLSALNMPTYQIGRFMEEGAAIAWLDAHCRAQPKG